MPQGRNKGTSTVAPQGLTRPTEEKGPAQGHSGNQQYSPLLVGAPTRNSHR